MLWAIAGVVYSAALPLIPPAARPHRGTRMESAPTVAIDISALVFLTGFVYWSLVIAPGMAPSRSGLALRILATVGPLVRLAALSGLLAAAWAARGRPWAAVYQRMALGMGVAFAVLVGLSLSVGEGGHQT